MEKTTFFPLYVDMKDRKVLVIGGGEIAARRTGVLLDFDADITVIAPMFCEKMQELAPESERLHLLKGVFGESAGLMIEKGDYFFVLAATDDSEVNRFVVRICREYGVPVNTADDAEACDFYFPAIIRKEELVIGVASAGKSHKKVRQIAQKIREIKDELTGNGER